MLGGTVIEGWSFNPPPYWPRPPRGWRPSPSWQPDPAWGPVPAGWQLWVRDRSEYGSPVAAIVAGVLAVLTVGIVGFWVPRAETGGVPSSSVGGPGVPGLIRR